MRYFEGRNQRVRHLMTRKFCKKELCRLFEILHSLFDGFPLGSRARLRIEGNEAALLRWGQYGCQ